MKDSKKLTTITNYAKNLVYHLNHWSELYTDLHITTEIRVATYRGQRQENDVKSNFWFKDLLKVNNQQEKKIVLLGDPGGGKTTASQKMTLDLAKNIIKSTNKNKELIIPVFFELNTFRKDNPEFIQVEIKDYLTYFIINSINIYLDTKIEKVSANEFYELLKTHKFVFFLDGLNEVGTNHRNELIESLKHFLQIVECNDQWLIITTRKLDYEYDFMNVLSNNFIALEILEFDGNSVNEYILRDLGNYSFISSILTDLPIGRKTQQNVSQRKRSKSKYKKKQRQHNNTKGKKLLDDIVSDTNFTKNKYIKRLKKLLQFEKVDIELINKIESNILDAFSLINLLNSERYQRIRHLATNPAILKDIIDVYRHDKRDLPKSRTRLSERAITVRIKDQEKKQKSKFSIDLKFEILRTISLHMVEPNEGLSINKDIALENAQELLVKYNIKAQDHNSLIEELIIKDNILVERTKGRISFFKQPYQEFFVAYELSERWKKTIKNNKSPYKDKYLNKFYNDRYYFQFVSLMSGLLKQIEVQKLVQQLRKRKKTIRLAALCIRNAEELPDKAVDDFISWSKKKILKASLLPENFLNLLLIIVLFVTLILNWSLNFTELFFSYIQIPSQIFSEYPVFFVFLIKGILLSSISYFFLFKTKQSRTYLIDYVLFALVPLSNITLIISIIPNNIRAFVDNIGYFSLTIQLLRFTKKSFIPYLEKLNIKIEEALVNKYLIPNLEIMRDIGIYAHNSILSIQNEIKTNRNTSKRILDAINRTWLTSPKTIIQAIEDIKYPKKQPKAVLTISNYLQNSEDKPDEDLIKHCIENLFFVIRSDTSRIAIIAAINSLSWNAKIRIGYRQDIISFLEWFVNSKRQIEYRQEAWIVLKNLGIKNIPYPNITLSSFLRKQFKYIFTVIAILTILILLNILFT